MGDFFFVVKCFAITLLIVILLQIKVGGRTLESQTVNWIHRSGLTQHLQDVAEGAVKAGKNGSTAVAGLFEDSADEIIPRNETASSSYFKVKRSEAYYRQKAREKKQKAAEQSEDRTAADAQDDADQEPTSDTYNSY